MKNKVLLLSILIMTSLSFSFTGDGVGIGDEAADFSLKNVDGKTVSLKDYKKAKGFIVVFTCNTCPFSVMYEQRIIDLHNKYASKGMPVIAINPNDKIKSPGDSFDKMVDLAKEKNYPFPYLYDETQTTTKAYGATNTPHVYVLKKTKKGNVVQYIGAIDNNAKSSEGVSKRYVEDAVDAVLNGDKVKETKTKAIGCTIKWAAS